VQKSIASTTPTRPLEEVGFKYQSQNTAAHAIARALLRHGVRHIFGQGVPNLLLLACEELGMTQVMYRAENCGGYMADGYARLSGKVPVVAAQNGPAATLLVAPLQEAMTASIPLVALVKDVPRNTTDKEAFQEIDHLKLFQGCTKWTRIVNCAERVVDYIDMAFAIAASDRPGPVALMLPDDMLYEAVVESPRVAALGRFPLDRALPQAALLATAAEMIAQARAPVVIAGGGVHLSGAQDVLARLQQEAHVPVATTMSGKGVVADSHPLSIGYVGSAMGVFSPTRYQRELVTDADLVILVGNRTNQNGTDDYRLIPEAADVIHIDVSAANIGRNYEALRLCGDAREVLEALLQRLSTQDLSVRAAARPAVEARIAQGREQYLAEAAVVLESDLAPIRPERLMHELDKVLQADDIVVADSSYSAFWIVHYLTARVPGQRFISPRGLSGLGWGFPMAVGAKLAAPGQTVYCVVGDGGFAHAWSELETVKRMGIKVVLLVLNNGILGYSKHSDTFKFGTHSGAMKFSHVDHTLIARACGCEAVTVRTVDEIAPALQQARASETTMLIDVMTDEKAFAPLTAYIPS